MTVTSGPDADLVAVDLAFDRPSLEVPAGIRFDLEFVNLDAVPHNVSIVDSRDGVLYAGELFTGPDDRTYEISAIPAGTYRFRCDVHPDMVGTLVAQ